jgi:hypothetical protein
MLSVTTASWSFSSTMECSMHVSHHIPSPDLQSRVPTRAISKEDSSLYARITDQSAENHRRGQKPPSRRHQPAGSADFAADPSTETIDPVADARGPFDATPVTGVWLFPAQIPAAVEAPDTPATQYAKPTKPTLFELFVQATKE